MADRLRLTISFDEPDEAGWIVARILQVPGAMSQERTRAEARENAIDALRAVLSPDENDPTVEAGNSEPLELTFSG